MRNGQRIHRLTGLPVLLAVAIVSGCGSSPAAPEQEIVDVSGVPAGPSAAGRIAYVSDDGNGMLITVLADGSAPRVVARNQPNFPAWSPDGSRLAWECHGAGGAGPSDSSLCVSESGGRRMHTWPATSVTSSLLRPGWSPDGRTIELDGGSIAPDGTVAQRQHCEEDGCAAGIALIKGNHERVIQPGCDADWPRFSPSGRRLAVVLECGMTETLVTIARDGSDMRQLAVRTVTDASRASGSITGELPSAQGTGAGYFDHIDWSPDGRDVVFAAGGHRGWDIHVSGWDGTRDHRLTRGRRSYYPSFSPDGRMIVYQRWNGASWDIWTMRSDGADKRAIVLGAGNDTKPTWCCRA